MLSLRIYIIFGNQIQMPYLEEWGALEGDYSKSLSEAIQALVNASLQLPIGGNVRV